jgi:hypothetical protein
MGKVCHVQTVVDTILSITKAPQSTLFRDETCASMKNNMYLCMYVPVGN